MNNYYGGSGTTLDVDFYGVVTFEVPLKEIVGMEYSNMLIENSSRIVLRRGPSQSGHSHLWTTSSTTTT